MTELKRSWLVQRLNKPHGASGIFGKDNPFAFGGGLRNGGLSDDAMDLLRGIFSFDYMGAAEFEFGEVPKALQRIAEQTDLSATAFEVPLSQVAEGWSRTKVPAPTGQATVYLLAPDEWSDEAELRIRLWAAEGYRAELKEATHLDTTLRPTEDYHGRTVGWLELNNGFMFFTDEQMWAQTCDLFGVAVEAVSA